MKKPTVLCIDDDTNILASLQRLLMLHGFEVLITAIERAFYEMAVLCKPDVILLDLAMPSLSGHTICHHLKSNPQTQSIPVIILSGKSDPESIALAKKSGADEFVEKPYNPENLVTTIRRHLKSPQHGD